MKHSKIIKSNGEKVEFEIDKLLASLKRSGASEQVSHSIASEIANSIHDDMTTREIYKKAFKLLKKGEPSHAARYHLKKGIMELGPSGFPFEKYLSEVLKFEGYEVKTNQIIAGKCVNHEIDIIAEKDNDLVMIECKFHNQPGYKCGVKIPLYIHSRFNDVEKQRERNKIQDSKNHQVWVATNTQFTSDAITYGTCVGMYLLGWDYPKNNSLKERIDASGLHPVTCLTTLTGREKQELLNKSIVLSRDISDNKKLLSNIGISDSRVPKIIAEARALSNK